MVTSFIMYSWIMNHAILTLVFLVSPAGLLQAQNIDFEHDGLTRRYRIHVPQDLEANAPLVLVLHGYGGNNNDMKNNYGWTELADQRGFVVAFPNGTRDPSNNRFWNVGYDFHQGLDVDDDGFLASLAVHLQDLHDLDPARAFVTGFSNGAEMCFQLACRESATFAAFAPITGMMLDTLFVNCAPLVIRPILSMNGTADDTTLFQGDMGNTGGWGAYRSIPETMDFWANLLQVPDMNRAYLPNTDPDDGSTVRLDVYSSGLNERMLKYYLVNGGGHDWPGQWGNMDVSATVEAWNFFDTVTGGQGVGGCEPQTVSLGDNAVDTTASRGNTIDLAGFCDPGEFGSDASTNTAFYEFVAPASGAYTISTCNQAAWDTRLSVHAGACAPENVVACLDDTVGCDVYTTTIEFTASAGSLYVIALGGFSITDYGPATMTISGDGFVCLGDLNGDRTVSGADLAIMLAYWNLPDADLNGDGNTSGADLTILLASWGACDA